MRELCRPYLTFYPPLDIYSNYIVTISLNHSFSTELVEDDNLSISLIEDRKACPLTTDSSFVHDQYKSGLICTWRWWLTLWISCGNFLNLLTYECLTQFYLTNLNWMKRILRLICSPFEVCIRISKPLQAWTIGL